MSEENKVFKPTVHVTQGQKWFPKAVSYNGNPEIPVTLPDGSPAVLEPGQAYFINLETGVLFTDD